MSDTWYVQSSFDTEVLQGKGRCMTASYKYNPINHNVQVSTAQFNEEWVLTDSNYLIYAYYTYLLNLYVLVS